MSGLVAVPPLSLAAERICLQHLVDSILLKRNEINTIADCNYEGINGVLCHIKGPHGLYLFEG